MNKKGTELQLCTVAILAKGNRLLNKKHIKGPIDLNHPMETKEKSISRKKEQGCEVHVKMIIRRGLTAKVIFQNREAARCQC